MSSFNHYAARQLWKIITCPTAWPSKQTFKEHEKIKVNYLDSPFEEFDSGQHCFIREFHRKVTKKGKGTEGNATNPHSRHAIQGFASVSNVSK